MQNFIYTSIKIYKSIEIYLKSNRENKLLKVLFECISYKTLTSSSYIRIYTEMYSLRDYIFKVAYPPAFTNKDHRVISDMFTERNIINCVVCPDCPNCHCWINVIHFYVIYKMYFDYEIKKKVLMRHSGHRLHGKKITVNLKVFYVVKYNVFSK